MHWVDEMMNYFHFNKLKDFAEATGVSASTLSTFKNRNKPIETVDYYIIERIARCVEVDPQWLVAMFED